MTERQEFKVSHNCRISLPTEPPKLPGINHPMYNAPQSNKLWRKLNYYRAKIYLFNLKKHYGQDWGYKLPVEVS